MGIYLNLNLLKKESVRASFLIKQYHEIILTNTRYVPMGATTELILWRVDIIHFVFDSSKKIYPPQITN